MLDTVANLDRSGDQLRKMAGWSVFLSVVIGFIAGVTSHSFPVFLLFVALAAVALAIYFFARHNDLSNNLRKFILPMITLMREDIDRGGTLTLRLNLSDPMAKEYQTGSETLRKRMNTEQTTYQLTWMEARTVLADDSTLELTITDQIRQRKTTRRNARGKVKVKLKYRVRHLIDVRIGFRRDSYALAHQESGPYASDMSVKEGEKRNMLRIRRVAQSSSITDTLPLNAVMETLSSAYGRVNLVKQEGN
ncbi:MAG: hypothetical protein JWQ98_156 [Chlorobi bacterium]|nr:hypothetical protein [Chlorobiota bacterium]